ncbi:MAG: ABC transporter ATP-binding protein [Porticoccaceae bacterium]
MIEVTGLEKSFKLYPHPSHRIKELLLRRPFHTSHQALKGISFSVAQGETLGIIGRNGAGKSTLLKILNGVLLPDKGQVACGGRVTGLLELGTGFDPALSGLQNIRTNGLLLGMSEAEIDERTEDIIAFADLGHFIHEPLRTYSSGMSMRLAFSIAIHADPQAFLIDEALSVGDGLFQQKCMQRIREFRASGGSIIFVSHDLNAVKVICDRVAVLNEGKLVFLGSPEDGVNYYMQMLTTDDAPETSVLEGGYGNFHAMIRNAALKGADSGSNLVTSGEEVTLDVDIEARESLPPMSLGLMIRDRFGQDIFGTNSHAHDKPIALAAGESCTLRFTFPMRLKPGKYTITLALHDGIEHTDHCYHWWDNATQFEVAGKRGPLFVGVCNLCPSVEIL